MLARGTAAEIAARDEYAAPVRLGSIQDEVRARGAGRIVAPVGEQARPEPLTRGRREKTRWNDLVRIDVCRGHHDRGRANDRDRLHSVSCDVLSRARLAVQELARVGDPAPYGGRRCGE